MAWTDEARRAAAETRKRNKKPIIKGVPKIGPGAKQGDTVLTKDRLGKFKPTKLLATPLFNAEGSLVGYEPRVKKTSSFNRSMEKTFGHITGMKKTRLEIAAQLRAASKKPRVDSPAEIKEQVARGQARQFKMHMEGIHGKQGWAILQANRLGRKLK